MGKDKGNEAKERECSKEKRMISCPKWYQRVLKKICWIQYKVIIGDIGENNFFFFSDESRRTLEGA